MCLFFFFFYFFSSSSRFVPASASTVFLTSLSCITCLLLLSSPQSLPCFLSGYFLSLSLISSSFLYFFFFFCVVSLYSIACPSPSPSVIALSLSVGHRYSLLVVRPPPLSGCHYLANRRHHSVTIRSDHCSALLATIRPIATSRPLSATVRPIATTLLLFSQSP